MSQQQEAPRLLDLSVELNNGLKIPKASFGTWKLPAEKATECVYNAIEAGYRHIDCARIYQNEPEVGAAFEKAIASGKVTRGDLWITSKLWNNAHHPDQVESACRRTLADLKCGYLDLYLIHWPVAFIFKSHDDADLIPFGPEGGALTQEVPLEDTWREMEKLVEKGLVKSIGVSNFSTAQVDAVLKIAKIKPVVNQVELHPALPQVELRRDMLERGLKIECYSCLGYGVSKETSTLIEDEEIQKIAAKAGLTPATFLLSWAGALKDCVLLTKSETVSRIKDNATLKLVQFPQEILDEVAAFGAKNKKRTVNPDIFQPVKGPLFFKE